MIHQFQPHWQLVVHKFIGRAANSNLTARRGSHFYINSHGSPSPCAPASALAAGRAALWFGLLRNFFRAALSLESGGRRVGSVDACSGALHGRDKRSGRRS